MYLQLFHGRTNPERDMDDWGFEGPAIGPLHRVHVTYDDAPRLTDKDCGVEFWLKSHEDMVHFGAGYYGDWVAIPNKADCDIVVSLREAQKWVEYAAGRGPMPEHECEFVWSERKIADDGDKWDWDAYEACCLCGKAKE